MKEKGFESFSKTVYTPNRVIDGNVDGINPRDLPSFVHLVHLTVFGFEGSEDRLRAIDVFLRDEAASVDNDGRVGAYHAGRISRAIGALPHSSLAIVVGDVARQLPPSVPPFECSEEHLFQLQILARLPSMMAELFSAPLNQIRMYAPTTIEFDDE